MLILSALEESVTKLPKCIICANFNEDNGFHFSFDPNNHTFKADCQRCGEYLVSENVAEDGFATHRRDAVRREWGLRLSSATRIAADAGKPLMLAHDLLKNIVAEAPVEARTAGEYFDRVLQIIGDACRSPGSPPPVGGMPRLAARSGVTTEAFMKIVGQLHDSKLVGAPGPSVERFSCSPTIDGWKRLDELTRMRPQSDRAFIAMWFNDKMRAARESMRRALEESGYKAPFLVDDRENDADPETKSKIDDQIVAMIRRARFVVCDFTGHRNSVYFEAGFAEGLGTPVIWCCRKNEVKKLAFDTRQHAHVIWESPEDLGAALTFKIEAKGWRLTPPK
jgi:nucleoside 2-deoxyribosyltransferase